MALSGSLDCRRGVRNTHRRLAEAELTLQLICKLFGERLSLDLLHNGMAPTAEGRFDRDDVGLWCCSSRSA